MKHILQKRSHTTAQFKEGMGDIIKKKHAVLIAQKLFSPENVYVWYNY